MGLQMMMTHALWGTRQLGEVCVWCQHFIQCAHSMMCCKRNGQFVTRCFPL
jgi:hypothetical protein